MKKPKKHICRWEIDWDRDVIWAGCVNPVPYPDECVNVLQQSEIERILNKFISLPYLMYDATGPRSAGALIKLLRHIG